MSSPSSPPPSPLPSTPPNRAISWAATEPEPDENNPDGPTKAMKLTIPPRLSILPPSIFILSASLGFIRSSRATSLRFMAENSHRPPRTVNGWYFYKKTKNYRVLYGGLKGAAKEGMRGVAVGCAWVGVEHYWKEILGEGRLFRDHQWVGELGRNTNEIAAGISTSAVVSAVYKLGWKTGLRTVALGAFIGGTIQVLTGMRRVLEEGVAERKLREEEDRAFASMLPENAP